MGRKWVSVIKGVRYREHPVRRNGKVPERYYAIRYSVGGKTFEEGVGWESDGYSDGEAIHLLNLLRRNIREGIGAQSLAEIRGDRKAAMEADRQAAVDAAKPERRPTFGDAARLFMERGRDELASWKADRSRIANHLLPLIGDMELAKIDKGHMADLPKRLAGRVQAGRHGRDGRTLSAGTVRHCMVLVGRVLEMARTLPVGDERVPMLLGDNPARGVKLRRHDDQRWRIATDQEVADILDFCRDHGGELAVVYRIAVLLAVECGARLEEIATLRKEHIDPRHKIIRLTDTKNTESRSLYPPEKTFREIQVTVAARPDSPWLFPGTAGMHIHKDTVSHFFRKATDALDLNAGITDRRGRLVFHSLRHTYGTRKIMAGTNPMVLKRLMGHKSLATTERYVHIAEEFLLAGR